MVRARCDLPNSSQPVTEEEPVSGPGFTQPDLCSIRATHGGFLRVSGDPVWKFGTEGAWLVTGHRVQRTGVAL